MHFPFLHHKHVKRQQLQLHTAAPPEGKCFPEEAECAGGNPLLYLERETARKRGGEGNVTVTWEGNQTGWPGHTQCVEKSTNKKKLPYPISILCQLMSTPVAPITVCAACTISGPMPSPKKKTSVCITRFPSCKNILKKKRKKKEEKNRCKVCEQNVLQATTWVRTFKTENVVRLGSHRCG